MLVLMLLWMLARLKTTLSLEWEPQSAAELVSSLLLWYRLALSLLKESRSLQVKSLLAPLQNTSATWLKRRSTWWLSTRWSCSNFRKSIQKKLRSRSARCKKASMLTWSTFVRTHRTRLSTSLARSVCQLLTKTLNTSSTESTMTTLARLISITTTRCTQLASKAKPGHLMSRTCRTTPKFSTSIRRITPSMTNSKRKPLTRIFSRSKVTRSSLEKSLATCLHGRRSLMILCQDTQVPLASE